MEIYEKIRFLRQFKGWSQDEMAEKLGITLNGYANIEHGKTDIQLSRLEQIAKVFGVDISDLFGLNEKNIFCFIESQNYNSQFVNFNSQFVNFNHYLIFSPTKEVDLKNELEKALSTLKQKEEEILYLKQIIESMKKEQ